MLHEIAAISLKGVLLKLCCKKFHVLRVLPVLFNKILVKHKN